MQISAISGQVVTSTSGVQKNNLPHSLGKTKEIEMDIFSKNNDVSFGTKNQGGKVRGTFIGGGVGVALGITAAALTGGLAIPALLAYLGALGGSTALGIGIGNAVDKKFDKEGKFIDPQDG